MKDLVQQFPTQLEDAVSRYSQLDFGNILQKSYSNIVCAGMGGSGIAASLIQGLSMKYADIPYIITKSYELPSSTNKDSLFLACSHSGNTEETIEATKAAYELGATMVVITSGGWMLEFAREHDLFLIQLPDGMMPRACYTYAVVAQLCLLEKLNVLNINAGESSSSRLRGNSSFCSLIPSAITLIRDQEIEFKNQARQIAEDLFGKIPVIYSDDLFAAIAMRFRQQLNENSKILCRNAIVPEMNHNEILGRKDDYLNCVLLFLRHSFEHPRIAYRMELTKEIISTKVTKIVELRGMGNSLLEEMITMIYILDWVSVYLADLREIDPTEIGTINFLKGKLAERR